MGFSKWLRDILDSKPQSLSLKVEHRVQPDSRLGPVEQLCRDFGMNVESVNFSEIKTAEQASSNRALLEQLLPAVETRFGKHDIQVSLVLHALACQFMVLSNAEEAGKNWSRCLSIREKTVGCEHIATVTVRHSLAQTHFFSRQYPRCIELLEQNLPIVEEHHPDFQLFDEMLMNLTQCYHQLGMLQKAETCLRRLYKRAERHGTGDVRFGRMSFDLGLFLANIGRFSEAIPILTSAVEILSRRLSAGDANLLRVKTVLSQVQACLAVRPDVERWTQMKEWPLKTVTDASTRATLRLPATWELTSKPGASFYTDKRMPQYNFFMSLQSSVPKGIWVGLSPAEALKALVKFNPVNHSAEFHEIDSCRAMASYKSKLGDVEGRKDDRHWMILDSREGKMRYVICTLSVLEDIARKEETDVLVEILTREMKLIQLDGESASSFIN